MFWCKHKYGKIEKDGYQYCEKCNKAFHPIYKCSHIWKHKYHIKLTNWDRVIGHEFVLQCKKCGEIKKVKT